jgi:hypothetical protein
MVKRASIVALVFFVAAGLCYGAAFNAGEKLVFSVSWSDIVKAGTATLSVPGVKVFNGHKVYHIVSTASSGPQVSAFFYTRDRIDVYLDATDYTIWKSEKHLVEGTYKNDEVIYFNPRNRTATRGVATMRTLPEPRDALGGFYYVRSLDLQVGGEITVNYADGKISKPIVIKVLRKEQVTVPAGTFDTIVIEPVLEETEGIFKQEGRIWIWVTDDENKMPVILKSKIAIGNVEVKLESYTLGS